MSFVIGYVPPTPAASIKHINHSRDTHHLRDGDVVQVLDHILQWDEHCVSEETCAGWRTQGDPLCDAALQEMFSSPSSSVGHDLLSSLESYISSHPGPGPAREFLDLVSQAPPTEFVLSEDQVRLAQHFFLDNGVQIMQALLHYSLAGGFARKIDTTISTLYTAAYLLSFSSSPRIVRTLQTVSYLVPHTSTKASSEPSPTPSSNDRTFARLLETMQFILDIFGCTSPVPPDYVTAEYLAPGNDGWRSAVRVRMLHGVARWRVRERWMREGKDVHQEETRYGVPINQEDLGATLTSFSTIPIWCLHRLHLPPSLEEANAYLALWRYIGFYLGVDPDILKRYFMDTRVADKFLVSTALHLFSDLDNDEDEGRAAPPTVPILLAASNRGPQRTSFAFNCALTRHLLGPMLSARLHVPPTTLSTYLTMHKTLLVQRIPNWFASWYPRRRWREKRRAVLREGLALSLRGSLGSRKVGYRPRTAVVLPGKDGQGAEGGELGDGVKDAERMKSNPENTRKLVREWKEVLIEMVSVCGCAVVILSVAAAWAGLRWTHSL